MDEKHPLALTFDTEWWGRAHLLTGVELHRDLDRDIARIHDLIELLERHRARATFFVVSDDFGPETLRAIADGGHEIASHSCSHPLFSTLDEAAWRDEVRRSKAVLEEATGRAVVGFRCPSWSVPYGRHLEFLDLLLAEGYEYDSSFCQFETGLYGDRNFPVRPFVHRSRLVEIPLPRIGFPRWPWVGGFYFRLLPSPLLRRFIAAGRPAFLYFHPWEFYRSHGEPGGSRSSLVDRFILNYGRVRNERKLDSLLAALAPRFDFVTMKSTADRRRAAG